MPFTFVEGLADFPELLSLVNKINEAAAAIPASSRKAEDYANFAVAILVDVARLADKVAAQAKD